MWKIKFIACGCGRVFLHTPEYPYGGASNDFPQQMSSSYGEWDARILFIYYHQFALEF